MYFTKNCAKYLFGTQTDSSLIIVQTHAHIEKEFQKVMASSSDNKEKVQLEEQALWEKLCSKLVSNNIYTLKTPFKGHFMFLIPVWMLDEKS